MAYANPSLNAADAAISFAMGGELTLFKAVVRAGKVDVQQLGIFYGFLENLPSANICLLYEVAKRGHVKMLRYLLKDCSMTPHAPTIMAQKLQAAREEAQHFDALRNALSIKLHGEPNKLMKLRVEMGTTATIFSLRESIVPKEPLSHALRTYMAKKDNLGDDVRTALSNCAYLLAEWEAKTPLPIYVPPALMTAEAYEAAYRTKQAEMDKSSDMTLDL